MTEPSLERTAHNPRDHAEHPIHVSGPDATDSAGTTWTGRDLSPSGFEADTGAADPVLRAVLADSNASDSAVMAQVQQARFLVPIVAEAVALDTSGPLAHDTHVDMAAVTLVAPDGQRALPVFTGLDSLAQWDPQARPVPVTAARMAEAAISEQCDVIVVDVAADRPRVLRASMIWALAQRRAWLPSAQDPFVDRSVAAAIERQPAVTTYALRDGDDGALILELRLTPGMDAAQVSQLATAIGEDLARDGEFRARVDALTFRLV